MTRTTKKPGARAPRVEMPAESFDDEGVRLVALVDDEQLLAPIRRVAQILDDPDVAAFFRQRPHDPGSRRERHLELLDDRCQRVGVTVALGLADLERDQILRQRDVRKALVDRFERRQDRESNALVVERLRLRCVGTRGLGPCFS